MDLADTDNRLSRIQTCWTLVLKAHQGQEPSTSPAFGELLLRYYGVSEKVSGTFHFQGSRHLLAQTRCQADSCRTPITGPCGPPSQVGVPGAQGVPPSWHTLRRPQLPDGVEGWENSVQGVPQVPGGTRRLLWT
jgi:hypothetical protein